MTVAGSTTTTVEYYTVPKVPYTKLLERRGKDMEKPIEEKDTYTKMFHCDNCEKDFTEIFEFGEIAYQPTCPYCGIHPNQL